MTKSLLYHIPRGLFIFAEALLRGPVGQRPMGKRAREGDDEAPSPEEVPAAGSVPDEQAQTGEGPASTPEDEADDQPLHKNFRMSSAVRTGADCPYLDTISRQVG